MDIIRHFRVTDCWPELCKELIASIEARKNTQNTTQPVILLGHSLGGMLSLMVARQRARSGAVCSHAGFAGGGRLAARIFCVAKIFGLEN